MTAVLRRATPADAAAIRELTRAAYAKWVPLIGREPLPMGVDYDDTVRRHRFDLLEEGDDLVALIETTPSGEQLLIVNVAVRPDRQGRGYGKRLLAHADALARETGLRRLWLYTNQRFEENIRLYAAVGYRIDREEPLNGGVAVHMMKTLEP